MGGSGKQADKWQKRTPEMKEMTAPMRPTNPAEVHKSAVIMVRADPNRNTERETDERDGVLEDLVELVRGFARGCRGASSRLGGIEYADAVASGADIGVFVIASLVRDALPYDAHAESKGRHAIGGRIWQDSEPLGAACLSSTDVLRLRTSVDVMR